MPPKGYVPMTVEVAPGLTPQHAHPMSGFGPARGTEPPASHYSTRLGVPWVEPRGRYTTQYEIGSFHAFAYHVAPTFPIAAETVAISQLALWARTIAQRIRDTPPSTPRWDMPAWAIEEGARLRAAAPGQLDDLADKLERELEKETPR